MTGERAWRWQVRSGLGVVREVSGCQMDAAGMAELFLTRTPGRAEAVIDGPDVIGEPVRIGAVDGAIHALPSKARA